MQQGGLGQAGQCLVRALNDDIRPGSNGTALPAVGGGQWQIVRAVGFVHDQGNVGGVAQSGNGGKITQNTLIGGAGKVTAAASGQACRASATMGGVRRRKCRTPGPRGAPASVPLSG